VSKEKIKPAPFSGHVHAQLSDDVVLQMNEAWYAWKSGKESGKPVNDIVDAYLSYADLMRKHVDSTWS